jgi:5-methylcytosine-specific restriction endonuclease McrA
MGSDMKLTTLKPNLTTLTPRLGYAEGEQGNPTHYRRPHWYGTHRWQRLRWQVLVRDMFTCARCHRIVADTSQLVCDHIVPHRGDVVRFWAGPFQTLCKPCHDQAKQIEDLYRS